MVSPDPTRPTPPTMPPLMGVLAVVVVVVALFTVAGWLLGAAWALVRLAMVVAVVGAVVWAVRVLRQ